MTINTAINRYIIREMIPPFVISIFFFIFIFLMTSLLEITNYIVNYEVSLVAFILFMLYTIPFSLQFIIPMSVMISILLTFLRMSNDNEVVALQASGISLYRVTPPVLLYCLIGCFLTCLMSVYGVPWGTSSIRSLKEEVVASSFQIGLKERTFNDSFKDVMLYVNEIDVRQSKLKDVFIEDKRNPDLVSTVVATEGRLLSDPERLVFKLRLLNGAVNQVDIKTKTVNVIQFESYDISLDVARAIRGRKKDRKHRWEMSLTELSQYIQQTEDKGRSYFRAQMEYHKKFSIPIACIPLGLLSMTLGFQSNTKRRDNGVILALTFLMLYYVVLSAAWGIGETGKIPPLIGMWLPNVIFGCLAVWLFIQTGEGRSNLIVYCLDKGKWFFRNSGWS